MLNKNTVVREVIIGLRQTNFYNYFNTTILPFILFLFFYKFKTLF